MVLGSVISAAAGLAGGAMGAKSQERQQAENVKYQKQFAKQGIRWKVEDAKKAGVHPLYAIGAQTNSFTPTTIGSSPLGNAMSSAGQDIGRAVDAANTPEQRQTTYQKAVQDANLQNLKLRNDLVAEQIASSRIARLASNPPFPRARPGTDLQASQGDLVKNVTQEVTKTAKGREFSEPGIIPSVGHHRTQTGYGINRSSDIADRLEDDTMGNFMWGVRNRILPSFGIGGTPPPKSELPEGFDSWQFNPFTQEYTPARKWGWFRY